MPIQVVLTLSQILIRWWTLKDQTKDTGLDATLAHAFTDRPLADGLIPPIEVIQTALERVTEEANLLRKLLRLALSRERTEEQLVRLRQALREVPQAAQG